MEVLDPEHSGINLLTITGKYTARNSGMTGHKIASGAIVENSMITDGCRIGGHVSVRFCLPALWLQRAQK